VSPAGEAQAEQRDTAILFAEVKGYSVLLRQDETGTYACLQRARILFRRSGIRPSYRREHGNADRVEAGDARKAA
jgi:hypothetical protein